MRSRTSSGRAVLTLIVAPMPPVGDDARDVLYTSSAEIASDDRLAKSKARPESKARPPPSEFGICRPFRSTMLNCGPTPRTVTREPSPLLLRSMDTPAIRCIDSARLVSGNLPMSSATMPSTRPVAERFRFSVDSMDFRMPVTTTVSRDCFASWAWADVVAHTAAATWQAMAIGLSCRERAPSRRESLDFMLVSNILIWGRNRFAAGSGPASQRDACARCTSAVSTTFGSRSTDIERESSGRAADRAWGFAPPAP